MIISTAPTCENTMDKLARFFDCVESIERKNSGGCLFFCYSFWLWLKENNMPTKSFKIVQYEHRGDGNIERNVNWINESGDVEDGDGATSSHHFTWLYDGEEYDAEGINDDSESSKTREVLTGLNTRHSALVECFCLDALNNAGWNTLFERGPAIELLEEELDIDLSEVNHEVRWG